MMPLRSILNPYEVETEMAPCPSLEYLLYRLMDLTPELVRHLNSGAPADGERRLVDLLRVNTRWLNDDDTPSSMRAARKINARSAGSILWTVGVTTFSFLVGFFSAGRTDWRWSAIVGTVSIVLGLYLCIDNCTADTATYKRFLPLVLSMLMGIMSQRVASDGDSSLFSRIEFSSTGYLVARSLFLQGIVLHYHAASLTPRLEQRQVFVDKKSKTLIELLTSSLQTTSAHARVP